MSMEVSSTLPPSSWEETFGFEHPGLRTYMASSDNTVEDLLEHVSSMENDNHPVVRYAAGWAAAEVGLYRLGPHNCKEQVVRQYRQEVLETADEHWNVASRDISAWRQEQPTLETASQARMIEVRLAQALAYVPLMGVAASWLAGEPLGKRLTQKIQQNTRQRSIDVGVMVCHLQESDFIENGKAEMAGEILCGLACQTAQLQKYTTIPTPPRSGRYGRSMSDFFIHDKEPPYRRKPIRSTPGCRDAMVDMPRSTATVSAVDDFNLRSKIAIYEALHNFNRLQNNTLDPLGQARLEDMGRRMATCLGRLMF